jgi:hypothetical protein
MPKDRAEKSAWAILLTLDDRRIYFFDKLGLELLDLAYGGLVK